MGASKRLTRSGLTPRQELFTQEVVRNGGNVTQAALVAYPNQDYFVAAGTGHDNLNKPQIRARVLALMDKSGTTLESLANKLHEHIEGEDKQISFQATKFGFEVYDALPDKHSTVESKSISIKAELDPEVMRFVVLNGRYPTDQERKQLGIEADKPIATAK